MAMRVMVATTTVMGNMRAMVMEMRLVSGEEVEGGMAMAMTMMTRMVGGQRGRQQRGQWQWQQECR